MSKLPPVTIKSERIAVVGNLCETLLGFRSELIRDMVGEGHKVYAFAPDFDDKGRQAVTRLGAIPVTYPIRQLGTNPLADLHMLWRLYRLFRQHRITVSYCYFIKPAVYGTLAAWLARVPLRVAKLEGLGRVFTRDPGGDSLKKRLTRHITIGLFHLGLPRAHKLFVLNQGDRDDLMGYGITRPEPEVLDGIGVCLERYRFCPPVDDPVRFVFIGRLLTEKGIRYFLEAARQLKAEHPKARFVVVGGLDTKPGAITRQELKQLEVNGTIEYTGAVRDIVPWLSYSSVFVLPTYYREGVPRSIQEALAMGRPVITTNMPGCRKTVDYGVNGYFVEPHDVGALKQAMLEFIRHPERIKPMGEASYRIARERFNVRKINRHILSELNLLQTATVVTLAARQAGGSAAPEPPEAESLHPEPPDAESLQKAQR